ncbi:hybrid sensor histidine kinase/response regulator [uncultured Desulfobulbus sp.]|uniref:hybrid sensor histidine kinase/response regulator n=1 Tax=uncultured Desulfobulbus sp. TaxID=239745 RepID=UPI0029C800DC|nr:hybrid sensor histidine kinase/response regulator [uncultured Desulfobulbus sp.]
METTLMNSQPIPSILVVDDTPANLLLLTGMLKGLGYKVRSVSDGEFAIQTARHDLPDLILLDVMMPGMNGYEVCKRLKMDDELSEIPVIFLSALNETADKVKAFEAGGVDYVTKPFQLREVQARVAAHLELHRQKKVIQESYDQLHQLEELRDNLVHMVVHDMRTPLTSMKGFLQLLDMVEGETMSKDGKEYINILTDATESLIELASSLLDVSKMEAGEMTLDLGECNMIEIIREVMGKVESLRGDRQFIFEEPKDPIFIQGDAKLLARVIQNLMGNALKFTPDDGSISIGIEAGETCVRVYVQDNGPGIPQESLGRIFEKFGQVKSQQNQRQYSTGLGLTFCKLAVETHGGTIGVDSEVGKGSSFWFSIPVNGPAEALPVDSSTANVCAVKS